MTPLGHAAAHERIADLALEPGALDRLEVVDTDQLAAHVATCPTCEREVRAWRETHAGIESARGVGVDRLGLAELAGEGPIEPPDPLRASVLSAVRRAPAAGASVSEPTPMVGPSGRLRLGGGAATIARRLLPLVAVLAVVAVGAGLLADRGARLDQVDREAAGLEALAVTVDRVLRDPEHQVMALRTAEGTVAGSISWSRHDIVVLTTALEPPPPDRAYRCWIERDGVRSPVGQMWFSGDTAYWNGSLDEWATISFDGGGTFGVSLEPVEGPRGNPAVLVADLSG